MWKRGDRSRAVAPSPLELCDLCGSTFPAEETARCWVPDSSAVRAGREWFDGLRLLTACGADHLTELRDRYRRRPFVQEELWAAKIDQVLSTGAATTTLEQLACRTGLHLPEIRRAVAWRNNRHRHVAEDS